MSKASMDRSRVQLASSITNDVHRAWHIMRTHDIVVGVRVRSCSKSGLPMNLDITGV